MPDDVLAETTANYDASADELAARYLNPAMLAAPRRAFLKLLPAGSFIVDIGAGPGRDVALFRAAGHTALGIEPSERFVAIANTTGHGPVITGQMRRIPVPAACADAAWIAGALTHVPKSEALDALREVRRILKPGAVLGLVIKEGDAEYWRVDARTGTRSFVAPYRPAELDALLAKAGFRVTRRRTITRDKSGEPRLERSAVAI